MEQIDIRELDKHDMKSSVFLEAFGCWCHKNKSNQFPVNEHPHILEIEFKVNGVELSFTSAMKSLEEIWDKSIQEEAKKLLSNHLFTLTETLEQKFSEILEERN